MASKTLQDGGSGTSSTSIPARICIPQIILGMVKFIPLKKRYREKFVEPVFVCNLFKNVYELYFFIISHCKAVAQWIRTSFIFAKLYYEWFCDF
jgi:hypothetical protein